MRKKGLFWLFLGLLTAGAMGAELPLLRGSEESLALRADIHSLNLLNGLELTPEQMQQVLALAKQAAQVREQARQALAAIEEAAQPAMLELRETLQRGGEIPPDLARRVHRAQLQRETILENLQTRLEQLAAQVVALLNENQLVLLDEYKPCLIPPKSRDQSRIGQPLDTSGGAARVLELIRRLPPGVYNQRREAIVQRLAQGLEHLLRRPVTEEERRQMLAALDEAYELAEADFVARREELIQRLKVYDLAERILAYNRQRRLNRIARFLLHPGVIPALEERLATQ